MLKSSKQISSVRSSAVPLSPPSRPFTSADVNSGRHFMRNKQRSEHGLGMATTLASDKTSCNAREYKRFKKIKSQERFVPAHYHNNNDYTKYKIIYLGKERDSTIKQLKLRENNTSQPRKGFQRLCRGDTLSKSRAISKAANTKKAPVKSKNQAQYDRLKQALKTLANKETVRQAQKDLRARENAAAVTIQRFLHIIRAKQIKRRRKKMFTAAAMIQVRWKRKCQRVREVVFNRNQRKKAIMVIQASLERYRVLKYLVPKMRHLALDKNYEYFRNIQKHIDATRLIENAIAEYLRKKVEIQTHRVIVTQSLISTFSKTYLNKGLDAKKSGKKIKSSQKPSRNIMRTQPLPERRRKTSRMGKFIVSVRNATPERRKDK